MGKPLTFDAAQCALRISPSGWWVRIKPEDRGRRGRGHLIPALLKKAEPRGGWCRPPNHKVDILVLWDEITEWVSRNSGSIFDHSAYSPPRPPSSSKPPTIRAPPPPPPTAPIIIPSPPPPLSLPAAPSPPPSPLPERTVSTPPAEPAKQQRNFLSRVLARKAEDALLVLSKEPSFPSLSRLAICESLTASLGFPITIPNLVHLAETMEVTLPRSRSTSSSSDSLSDIRLTRIEDAITFLFCNFGVPATPDLLRQLEVVRTSWLTHLSSHRTPET